MKKLIEQILKFGVVGVICFIIDYGLMIILTEFAGLSYLFSCGISFSVSVIVNYILSMRYVFRAKKDANRKAEFVFFVGLSIIGLILTELLMLISVDYIGIHYMVAKVFVTAIVMIYNFVTRKLLLEDKVKKV